MTRPRGNLVDAKRSTEKLRQEVNMPIRPFLYTLDQIAGLLSINLPYLTAHYTYFEGRSIGVMSKDLLLARNIAPRTQPAEWRIAERELIRWLKRKGYRVYDSTILTH